MVLKLRHKKKYFKFSYLTIQTMLISVKMFKQLCTWLKNENKAKTRKTRLKQNILQIKCALIFSAIKELEILKQ